MNNLNLEDESTDDERSRNRRQVEVILSRPCSSSDDEIPRMVPDLHDKLRRETTQPFSTKTYPADLWILLKRKITTDDSSLRPRVIDLREKLNSKTDDLRVKLNRSKGSDLRHCLEAKKQHLETDSTDGSPTDLRTQLEMMRPTRTPHLNVIMGGSPPCGDSVREGLSTISHHLAEVAFARRE